MYDDEQPTSRLSDPMTDDELKAIVDAEIHHAMGYIDGELSSQRAKGMKYYLGENYGDEIEGRSSAKTTEVADTVEWMLPELLDDFTSADNIAKFDPIGEEDEDQAAQETDYINYKFRKDCQGFLVLYTWFKDALIQKNGIVKLFWDETKVRTKEEYSGINDDEFQYLLNDPELEPVEHTQRVDETFAIDPATGQQVPQQQTMHDVVFERTTLKGKPSLVAIPPEEFIIGQTATSPDAQMADVTGHKTKKTFSDLVEAGFDPEIVYALAPDEAETYDEERVARRHLVDEWPDTNESVLDKSRTEVWVYEMYMKVDFDGDGVSELRKITKAGNQILENIEVDQNPFYSITPYILTHKFFGQGIYDIVGDLQYLKSTLLRQILDNTYFINNQRVVANEDNVNLDDLLVSRPGSVVRTTGIPAQDVAPLQMQPFGPATYGLLDYIDGIKEQRTGVTKYNQGLDAETLNKTATGIDQIMTKADKRIKLIARIFAEVGVKPLLLGLHKLLMQHQDKEEIVKLRNEWVAVAPDQWRTRENVTISVGLGTGNREKMLMHLNNIYMMQKEAQAIGVATPKHIYNTMSKIVENAQLRTPDTYFLDPSSEDAQQLQAQQAQQAEQQMQAQQQAMAEQQQALFNMQREIEQMKLMAKAQETDKKHMHEMHKLELEKLKIQLDTANKRTEFELKHMQNIPGAVI